MQRFLAKTADRLDTKADQLAAALDRIKGERFWRDVRSAMAAPIKPGHRGRL